MSGVTGDISPFVVEDSENLSSETSHAEDASFERDIIGICRDGRG